MIRSRTGSSRVLAATIRPLHIPNIAWGTTNSCNHDASDFHATLVGYGNSEWQRY